MISFKQFIAEARMAPLYHATHGPKLEDIINRGLMPFTYHPNAKLNLGNRRSNLEVGHANHQYGVSLTRSIKFAKNWGNIILELDQNKLNQRYKIVPIQYFQSSIKDRPARKLDRQGHNNEYEEFVVTSKPIPFSFITTIYYTNNRYTALPQFDKIRDKYPHIKIKEI